MMLFRLLFICVGIPASVFTIVVRIEQGELNGALSKSRNGSEFYSFYAIPYALPPVGERRFQPPQGPPPSWNGTRNATQEPPMCLQNNSPRFGVTHDERFKNVLKSEDCLFLNVFTPELAPTKPLPVLVYIHGGGLVMGGADMAPPEYFLDKPLILVTINYRLGIFGFFSTADHLASGNSGLKDQTAALRWVQKNIAAFGGDPQAVTIMGQSAGAGSVQMHMFSPLSKGLFHKAIMHSGVAIVPWMISLKANVQSTLDKFLQFTKCNQNSTTESVGCLRALSGDKLEELANQFSKVSDRSMSFRPTIEDANIEGAFLNSNPMDLPYQQIPEVPAIIGFTSNESAPQAEAFVSKYPKITDEILNAELPDKLNYNIPNNPEVTKNITERIKKIYFAGDVANANLSSIVALFSDFTFKLPGLWGVIKTYSGMRHFYEYDYRNSATKGIGAKHADDLISFFPRKGSKLNNEDLKLSQELIKYWSNFITTRDPNTPDGSVPTNWTPVTSFPADYLHISKEGLIVKTYNDDQNKEALWHYVQNAKK